MPFPLSVVDEIVPLLVPPVLENKIAEPPVVSVFPLASLAVNVSATVFPEVTVLLDTEITDCARDIAPGLTVIVGEILVTALPPIVAVIDVADPEFVAVKIAV